ncbi:MAG: hypothetical protein NVS3B10_22700 [Polyangiales bacterium]
MTRATSRSRRTRALIFISTALRRSLRRAVALGIALACLLALPSRAEAYPWMIRHGYVQCANCHADPAGGGLLNTYGRAQGEILMHTRYGASAEREPGPFAEPLYGVLDLPRSLLIGADGRYAYLRSIPLQGQSQGRFILMQADAYAQLSLGRIRANASAGYVSEGGNAAAITVSDAGKLISRVHWVGVDLGKHDEVLVRAGRMNLPFGIRSIEHTQFTRRETRTDTNTGQSYGVEADYHRGPVRASLMGIAGNFLVSPDRFRSRGWAGLAELAILPTLAVGVSTMAVRTELDLPLLTPTWRHAHGAFARYSPTRAVVVSGEWDFLHTSQPTPGRTFFGGVGTATVDLEPTQGLHVGPTVEVLARDFGDAASYGVWASAWWFFLPHADVRFDVIENSLAVPGASATKIVSAIVQLHVYL